MVCLWSHKNIRWHLNLSATLDFSLQQIFTRTLAMKGMLEQSENDFVFLIQSHYREKKLLSLLSCVLLFVGSKQLWTTII